MSIVARILALLSETGSPRATLTRGMGTQLDLPFGHELPSRPPSQFEPTQMPMEGIESPDPLPRQLRMLLEQETYPYGPSAGTPTGDVSIVPEVPFVPRHAATSEDRMLKHIADLEALGTRGSVGAGVSRPEPEPMVPGPELFPGRLMPGEGEDPRAFLPRFGREAEVVGAQPEGLDLEGPSLLLDQPLDRQMREAGQLSRKVDESVQRGLDYTQDAFAESLVPAMGRRKAAVASLGEDPAQDEWVRLLRDKAMETPLGRIDDPGLDQVGVGLLEHIEADVGVLAIFLVTPHTLDHHRAVIAGILGDAPHRLFQRAAQNEHPGFDVSFGLDRVERGDRIDQGHPAAGHDAFLDRGAGGAERILDPVLLLFQLGFGGRADLDDRHPAGELGQPLLQLLAVEIGGGGFDLGLDLLAAALDGRFVAIPLDDRGVILGADHPAGPAQILDGDRVELAADLLGDDLPAGQHRDIAQHLLAAVAEAGGLDRGRH